MMGRGVVWESLGGYQMPLQLQPQRQEEVVNFR